jgi:hypothetical protein
VTTTTVTTTTATPEPEVVITATTTTITTTTVTTTTLAAQVVLGNRIGLTYLDVQKMSLRFQCSDATKLCTHRVTDPCTLSSDCACHLHEFYGDDAPVAFKVEEIDKTNQRCYACREQCPLYGPMGSCSLNDKCVCIDDTFNQKINLQVSETEGHEGQVCYVCGSAEEAQAAANGALLQGAYSSMRHTGFFVALTANPSLQIQEAKCLPERSDDADYRAVTRCCKDGNKKISMKHYAGCSAVAAFRSPAGARICKGCEAMRSTTHEEAQRHCEKHRLRLCTREEVQSCKTCETGCFFDAELMWTSTPCDPHHAPRKAIPKASKNLHSKKSQAIIRKAR